jgi:hypothetical protein
MDACSAEITTLLNPGAAVTRLPWEQLAEQVYPGCAGSPTDVRKTNARAIPLEATAPVYEVYLRLEDVTKIERQERACFFAMAAQMMRRIRVTAGARRWCAITRRRLAKGEHRGDRRFVRRAGPVNFW